MNFKKFLAVFCPLLLVLVMVAGVAAYSYPELYTKENAEKSNENETKLKAADGVYNVLLIGRDRGGKLTDTIMFVRVDNDNNKVNILSVPRDTYVDGWKINAMYSIGGIEETVECVEDIVGLDVDFYVSITTDVFREIVDSLDGVQFYVPQNMDYEDPVQGLYIHLQEGDQLLDGDKAEQLVRFRSYIQGDIQRTQVQRDFIQALITQKKSLKYINKVDDLYKGIADKIETNITLDDILSNIITFKNLDATNNLKAHVMPNDPQNVGGISYVFVLKDELRELLITEFGVKEDEFNAPSGRHSFGYGGGYDSYTSSYDATYDDNTAWFEPEVTEEPSADYSDENSEGIPSEDVFSEVVEGESEFVPEGNLESEYIEENTVVEAVPETVGTTDVYEEYPDAAGVPLD